MGKAIDTGRDRNRLYESELTSDQMAYISHCYSTETINYLDLVFEPFLRRLEPHSRDLEVPILKDQ